MGATSRARGLLLGAPADAHALDGLGADAPAALGGVPLANLEQEKADKTEFGYLCFLLFRIRWY